MNIFMGSEKSGKKNDFQDGKLRWDLLPLEEIEDIVKLYTAGSIKYGDNNWQGLENGYQRYKAAMLRHLLEYEKGNKIDEETKVNHLAAVAWNAIAMLYLDKHGKGKVNDNK
ncbi:MAG: dATP/dGTP diphosphohydrolase domain-containing protein [Romboutsia timonensis]